MPGVTEDHIYLNKLADFSCTNDVKNHNKNSMLLLQ